MALVASIGLPIIGALGSAVQLRRNRDQSRWTTAAISWIATALALFLAVAVAIDGPTTATLAFGGHRPVVGLLGDQLTVTLLVVIFAIGGIVQSFALRYLRTDGRRGIFLSGAGSLIASMGVVSASATLAGLVVAWVAASASFVAIVGYRLDLPGVPAAALRTRRSLLIGDAALISALVIVASRAGNVEVPGLAGTGAVVADLGSWRGVIAVCVVIAALSRCAQGPFGGWLPATVAAPTPVSALLHAGFVNGGGILLVRLGALGTDSVAATASAFAVASISSVVATAIMARRADVKSELAYSTMGQMGFMVAECCVGAFAAALVHLVGHAFYKAALFLGSGSGVVRPGGIKQDLPRHRGPGRVVASSVAAIGAAGVLAAVPGASDHRGSTVLLAFVGASAGMATWNAWSSRRKWVAAWIGGTLVASLAYGLVAGALDSWIQPALPPVGAAVLSPWLLSSVALGGAALSWLSRSASVGPWVSAVLIDSGISRNPYMPTTVTPLPRAKLPADVVGALEVIPSRSAA